MPLRLLALVAITAGAAALRFIDLGSVRGDPFYDAAVRSMSLSWHNFFFGSYEPGGSVSIDKPPLDLWLQVASVKLFGYGSAALKLPAALAGTASVPLLYVAVRRALGSTAGLVAALVLALLPAEVITARSDTMDAVMMLLLVLALLMVVLACESGRAWWLLGAAAVLGLAFNVKLLESFVALPGLLVIAWLGMGRTQTQGSSVTLGRRLSRLGTAAVVYIIVALSWLGVTLMFAPHERPYAIGSTNGSAWNAAFVFNGVDRITGKVVEPGQPSQQGKSASGSIAPPSPTRLLARSGQLPGTWLGWEALLALLLGAPAVLTLLRGKPERVARASALGLLVWLVTGIVLFSAMARLHTRYVEGFTPAVAAVLGIAVAWLAGLPGRRRWLAGIPLVLLVIPLVVDVKAIKAHTTDAGDVGALREPEQRVLSAYLRAHQGHARYEVAAGSATSVASLIVRDVRPVLMLTTYEGRSFTSVAQLQRLIATGAVRYAFLNSACATSPAERTTTPASAGCAPAARWIRTHGIDVSRQAGLQTHGILWELSRRKMVAHLHTHAYASKKRREALA